MDSSLAGITVIPVADGGCVAFSVDLLFCCCALLTEAAGDSGGDTDDIERGGGGGGGGGGITTVNEGIADELADSIGDIAPVSDVVVSVVIAVVSGSGIKAF